MRVTMHASMATGRAAARFRIAWLALMLLSALSAAAPVAAHKNHGKVPPPGISAEHAAPPAAPAARAAPPATPSQTGQMEEEESEDRRRMTGVERLLDWLGRLHPIIVHFPIAFFPAALFTAIVGRRRPAFSKPVQFLVTAGGITAPVAALLGWLNAGFSFASDDELLQPHRWLGTAIGAGAAGLAFWAWRRPREDRSALMITMLGLITAAIVVQGWFGGAMVHGIDHLNY